MDAGHSGRSRHAVRGAETSDGGWRVTGVGKFQLDVVPCRNRRWGEGYSIDGNYPFSITKK